MMVVRYDVWQGDANFAAESYASRVSLFLVEPWDIVGGKTNTIE